VSVIKYSAVPKIWTRGLVPAALALLVAVFIEFHRFVPNTIGNLGSLLETFLPWLGWLVLPLAIWAALRRSVTAGIAVLIPLALWVLMFGELLPDKSDGQSDLRVLTHNVDVDNTDTTGTVQTILDADPDIIALEELDEQAQQTYQSGLAQDYQYSAQFGTVGLWSRYEILESRAVDIGIGWTRAMRAQLDTPAGPAAVYIAHLASVRVGSEGFTSQQRDNTAQALGRAIADEQLERVILLGDLNGTLQDRSLAPITYQLNSTQAEAGSGFGFSWPASFPMTRIDQILVRGITATKSWTLEPTGSDHLPLAADLLL
jgi:vancomycin resistance protein VanJ